MNGYGGNHTRHPAPTYVDDVTPAYLPVMITISDYLWNPSAYNEAIALERAFRSVGGPVAQEVGEAWAAVRTARATSTQISREDADRWIAALEQAPNQDFVAAFTDLIESVAEEP